MSADVAVDPLSIGRPEALAVAAREGRLGGFRAVSDFAACLMPLLDALGWRGDTRHLLEALPHFADTLDLIGLRNVLAALNYRSRPATVSLSKVDPRLMPCLFVPSRGAPLVLLRADGERLLVFDGKAGEERWLPVGSQRGRAYFIDRVDDEGPGRSDANWMAGIALRFRGLFYRMFAITFASNLIALSVPLFVMVVYDRVIGSGSVQVLKVLVVGIALALACDLGLRVVRAQVLAYVAARVTSLVGAATLRQILFLPPAYTELASVSGQVSRIKEFESAREFFTGPLATVVLDLPFVVLFLAVIAWLAGPVALVPLAMLVAFLVAAAVVLPTLRENVARSSKVRAQRQGFLIEMLQNLRTIKQMAVEDKWIERYRAQSAAAAFRNFRAAQLTFLIQTLSHVFMLAAGIGTLAAGTHMALIGELSIGALIATMALVWRVLSPLQIGFVTLSRLEQVRLGVRQINQLMRIKTERDPSKPIPASRRFTGEIAFSRVSMRYRPDGEPALLGATLAIKPGECVAIVGPSGAGKSTVLKVMAGLYQPQAGTVMIDGFDIRQIDVVELRHSVAYLPQACQLFHGTIAQNLRLAEPTAEDAALQRACAEAGVLDDIQSLPEGFETRIGDQLLRQLPSGFQQRLALARAYLKPAPILLFDEPGQTLDEVGDAAFMAALGRMKGKKTIVLVTHRPSHMRMADRLLVLQAGQVVMEGPPDEVIEQIPRGVL